MVGQLLARLIDSRRTAIFTRPAGMRTSGSGKGDSLLIINRGVGKVCYLKELPKYSAGPALMAALRQNIFCPAIPCAAGLRPIGRRRFGEMFTAIRSASNRRSIAADCVTAHLNQKRLPPIGIVFLRRHADQIAEPPPSDNGFAIRTSAGHASKVSPAAIIRTGMGKSITGTKRRISRSIAALVMPTDGTHESPAREIPPADNLMANDGVIRHLAELFGIERTCLGLNKAPVNRHLAMSCKYPALRSAATSPASTPWPRRSQRHSAHPQKEVTVNIDVLHRQWPWRRPPERVIETVQGSHQTQVLSDPLARVLCERVVVYGETNVAARRLVAFKFGFKIRRVARPPAQRDHSSKLAHRFQRRMHLKSSELRCRWS